MCCLETKLATSLTSSLLGLIVGVSAGSLIVMVVVVSFITYRVIKWKRRSASSSASNKCRIISNRLEELDNITHNCAYGQVKETQLAQDGDVVYETIKDNCLYETQANEAYGPLQHNTPCYENPDKVITWN